MPNAKNNCFPLMNPPSFAIDSYIICTACGQYGRNTQAAEICFHNMQWIKKRLRLTTPSRVHQLHFLTKNNPKCPTEEENLFNNKCFCFQNALAFCQRIPICHYCGGPTFELVAWSISPNIQPTLGQKHWHWMRAPGAHTQTAHH